MAHFTVKRNLETPGDWAAFYENEVAEGRMTMAAGTSEFSVFMTRNLKAEMTRGHEQAEVAWKKFATMQTSDGEYNTYAGLGDPTGIDIVDEGQAFPFGRFTHDRATIVNDKIGMVLPITKELINRDRSGQIKQLGGRLGESHAKYKDKKYAYLFNNGTSITIYDASTMFANNHPDVTGSATNSANDNNLGAGTLSQANLESGLQTMAGWVDFDGEPLATTPKLLIVSSNQLQSAIRLMRSPAHWLADLSSGVVNPLQGSMEVVLWPRLTASTWYIKTMVEGIVHQQEQPLTLEQEPSNVGASFLRDVMLFKSSEVWGHGVTNWRAVAKGN